MLYYLLQQRNYIKIIDAVAIVGGFIKSSMVILRFLSKPFTKMALQVSLLNELFSFDESNDDNQNDGDGSRKDITTLHKLNKEDQEKEMQENILINKILNQEIQNHSCKQFPEANEKKSDKVEAENTFKKFMKIGQNTLSMGAIDYIKFYLSCFFKQKKNSQIKQSKKKVNERLDIVYILKKLVEIDKLKMILLNDQQRRVFDYLPKPLVKVQFGRQRVKTVNLLKPSNVHINARTEWSLIHSEFSPYQKAILAVKAFQNIMKSESTPLSLIDLKLIEMLDPEIIKRFCALQLNTLTDFGQYLDQENHKIVVERISIPKILNNDIKSIKCLSETDNLNTYQQQPIIEGELSLRIENQSEKNDNMNHANQSPKTSQDFHTERSNTGREAMRDSALNILKNNTAQQNKIENNFEQKYNFQSDKVLSMYALDIGKSKITESIMKSNLLKLRTKDLSNNGQNDLPSPQPIQNSNKLQIVQQFFHQRKKINSLIVNTDSTFIDQLLYSQYNALYKPSVLFKPDFSKSTNQPYDNSVSQNPMSNRIQKQMKEEDQRLNTIDESVYHENAKQFTPQLKKKDKDKTDFQNIQLDEHLNDYEQSPSNDDIKLYSSNNMQPQLIAQERTNIQDLNPSLTVSQIKNNKFLSILKKSEFANSETPKSDTPKSDTPNQ